MRGLTGFWTGRILLLNHCTQRNSAAQDALHFFGGRIEVMPRPTPELFIAPIQFNEVPAGWSITQRRASSLSSSSGRHREWARGSVLEIEAKFDRPMEKDN